MSPKFSTLCVFTRDENTELTIAISLGGLGAAAQSPTRFATSWRLGYLPFSSRSTTDGTLRWLSVWLNRPEICRRLFCWESFQVVPMMAHQKWDSVAAFSCSPTISPGWCCFGCWDRWHVFCKLFDPVVGEGTGTKRIGSKYPRLLQCQAFLLTFLFRPSGH